VIVKLTPLAATKAVAQRTKENKINLSMKSVGRLITVTFSDHIFQPILNKFGAFVDRSDFVTPQTWF